MPGRIGFEINLGSAREPGSTRRRQGEPFRVLVMADLSGRRNRGLESCADLAERRCVTIDVDSFESEFERITPTLSLRTATGVASLQFKSLEAFHPDQLFAA